MKKTESNNLAEKKTINENLKVSADNSSKSKNLNQDPEKTQGTKYRDFINAGQGPLDPNELPFKGYEKITEAFEEAKLEEKNISEQMDEIIRINDKFTLVESILYLLCKELEIPDKSQPGAIGTAIKALYEAHYKSMENWKNITKSVQKDDIRQ